MRDGSTEDVDPKVKRWIARKYEEGASRQEIKEGLRGSVEDLSVVDRVIDSGAVERKMTAREDLFQQGFLYAWRASIKGVLSLDESFFQQLRKQPSYQAVGILLANVAVYTTLTLGVGILFGGVGMIDTGFLMMAGVMLGMVLFAGVISGGAARMLGGSFVASFNACAVMSVLFFLSIIPFVGFFMWIIGPFVYYHAISSANGFSWMETLGMMVIVLIGFVGLFWGAMAFWTMPWEGMMGLML